MDESKLCVMVLFRLKAQGGDYGVDLVVLEDLLRGCKISIVYSNHLRSQLDFKVWIVLFCVRDKSDDRQ